MLPPPLVLFVTGAATGMLGSMLGLGGGVFLVPLLTLGLGVPIRVAIAASLISVMATAVASASVNLDRGLVNMRLGLLLEVATVSGALLGGLLAAHLTQRQLYLMFALTMASMGIVMAMRSRTRNVISDLTVDVGVLGGRLQEGDFAYVYKVRRLGIGVFASLVAGAVSGLLGLGGGIIKVPILNTFCGVPIRVAAATSTFMIGITTAASAFLYYGRGEIVLPLTAAVALGALPGSLVGARLSERVATRSLQVLTDLVLLGVGLRMGLEGR
jgi:uncharacterized protein